MNAAYDSAATPSPLADRPTPTDTEESERSITTILTDLWERTEMLVRQEMKLGLTEAEEKVDALKLELYDKVDGLKLEVYGKVDTLKAEAYGKVEAMKLELIAKAIGGVLGFAGLMTIVAGIVLLLGLEIKPWLAALLVGAVLSATSAALLMRATKPAGAAKASNTNEPKQRALRTIEERHHDAAK